MNLIPSGNCLLTLLIIFHLTCREILVPATQCSVFVLLHLNDTFFLLSRAVLRFSALYV